MKNVRFGKPFVCVMVFIFPLSAICADMRGAMFFVAKTAMVNGSAVNRSTAIFDGDKVQVPSDSSASITTLGALVMIGPGSTVTYKGKKIELADDSGVVVHTTSGLGVQVEKLSIAPAQGTARYQVARAGGTVLIAAKTGPVTVFDGTSSVTVAEGKTAAVPDPGYPDDGASGAGTKVVDGKKAALILGAAAVGLGAGIALGLNMNNGNAPVSPSAP